jgi:hypothetical protein
MILQHILLCSSLGVWTLSQPTPNIRSVGVPKVNAKLNESLTKYLNLSPHYYIEEAAEFGKGGSGDKGALTLFTYRTFTSKWEALTDNLWE